MTAVVGLLVCCSPLFAAWVEAMRAGYVAPGLGAAFTFIGAGCVSAGSFFGERQPASLSPLCFHRDKPCGSPRAPSGRLRNPARRVASGSRVEGGVLMRARSRNLALLSCLALLAVAGPLRAE